MTEITKKDIKKLALLSRISVNEKETKELQKDLEKILGFVSKLKEVSISSGEKAEAGHRNIMRKDDSPHKSTEYSEALLKEAPETKDGFVKVKKVI